MGGIDRDTQIRPNTLFLQNFRKRHSAEPTHGVADQDDRLRVFAVIVNRLRGDQAADRELIDVIGDTDLIESLPQTIDAAREERAQRPTKQIGAAAARLRRREPGRWWR